jgi:cytochrome c oxidase assembly factor CtaG
MNYAIILKLRANSALLKFQKIQGDLMIGKRIVSPIVSYITSEEHAELDAEPEGLLLHYACACVVFLLAIVFTWDVLSKIIHRFHWSSDRYFVGSVLAMLLIDSLAIVLAISFRVRNKRDTNVAKKH